MAQLRIELAHFFRGLEHGLLAIFDFGHHHHA